MAVIEFTRLAHPTGPAPARSQPPTVAMERLTVRERLGLIMALAYVARADLVRQRLAAVAV